MEVVFHQRWRGYRPGRVAEMADGAANILIRRKIVTEAPKSEQKPDDKQRRRK